MKTTEFFSWLVWTSWKEKIIKKCLIWLSHLKLAKIVSKSIDSYIKGINGMTSFHYACKNGQNEVDFN